MLEDNTMISPFKPVLSIPNKVEINKFLNDRYWDQPFATFSVNESSMRPSCLSGCKIAFSFLDTLSRLGVGNGNAKTTKKFPCRGEYFSVPLRHI